MATGASKQKQSADPQTGGGNLVGTAPSAPVRKPGNIAGKSGQPDNQTTWRGKGKT